jgi:hypothetical protein
LSGSYFAEHQIKNISGNYAFISLAVKLPQLSMEGQGFPGRVDESGSFEGIDR